MFGMEELGLVEVLKIRWLMEQWARISGGEPFCLKGIQSVSDAMEAVEMGVDGAIASLDALEKIVAGEHDVIFLSSSIPLMLH
jgi:isopentenyl diphosphate isomerase/L-lactate dehydrogenase-like FMN-dependent dehydrogenase